MNKAKRIVGRLLETDEYDPKEIVNNYQPVKWATFTRRTNDPKLAWIENALAEMGIPSQRSGHSFHAPILQVPVEYIHQADAWLASPFDGETDERTGKTITVDDMPDDDPVFGGNTEDGDFFVDE